jgi:hypothetical protein
MGESKHYVLTYMDGDQDRSKTYAVYQGEFDTFPVKVSYWENEYLVVPNWFNSKEAALEYIEKLEGHTRETYCLVQERHYANEHRIATAKRIALVQYHVPIHPSRGETQEGYGEPMIEVWTMYFMGEGLAEQYVHTFNADSAAARALKQQSFTPEVVSDNGKNTPRLVEYARRGTPFKNSSCCGIR